WVGAIVVKDSLLRLCGTPELKVVCNATITSFAREHAVNFTAYSAVINSSTYLRDAQPQGGPVCSMLALLVVRADRQQVRPPFVEPRGEQLRILHYVQRAGGQTRERIEALEMPL